MPTKRISMRNLREILRPRLQAGLSLRQIQSSRRVSLGAVKRIASQATAQGLVWSAIEQLDDTQLTRLFILSPMFGSPANSSYLTGLWYNSNS
jgi:hypothetical protein